MKKVMGGNFSIPSIGIVMMNIHQRMETNVEPIKLVHAHPTICKLIAVEMYLNASFLIINYFYVTELALPAQ